MTVIVRKPTLNIREELSALKKPTGIFGEQIMRTQTANEFYGVVGTNRNMLINGGFDVWQRGTTVSSIPAGTYYSADMWHGYSESTGRNYSQNATEALSIGFNNCLEATNGSAAPSFYQKIEDVRTAAGKTVTLSFWIKSNIEHTPTPQKISQFFGTGGSSEVAVSVPGVRVTTQWTRHVITVQLPSVAGKTIGPGSYLLVYPFTMDASKTYWTTGWQLEVGTVATPFEYRLYPQELAMCQRYYYRVSTGSSNATLGSGFANTSALARIAVPFPVEMRVAPTALETSGVASDYKVAFLTTSTPCTVVPSFANASRNMAGVAFTTDAVLTPGHGVTAERNANTAILAWSAEIP